MRGRAWHGVRRFAVRPAALMVRAWCARAAEWPHRGRKVLACAKVRAQWQLCGGWMSGHGACCGAKLLVWQAETARGVCSALGSRKRSQSSTMQVPPLSRRTLGARKASAQAQWFGHCWRRTAWRMVWTSALLSAGGRRTGDWRHPGVLGGTQMAGMLGRAVAAS